MNARTPLFAALALGFIAGGVGSGLVFGHRIEQLSLDYAASQEQASRLQNEISGLQKSLKARQNRPIERVEVHVIDVDDERVRLGIEKQVYDLFEHFVGDDMNRLDATTIRRLVDRTLIIAQKHYRVRVWGVFAEKTVLQLYVTASPG